MLACTLVAACGAAPSPPSAEARPSAPSLSAPVVTEPVADASLDETPELPPPGPMSEDPAEAPELVELAVPGDRKVLIVPGETRTPIVYLHGRCGDPTAFRAWAAAGRRFGTILSFVGDVKCKGGRTKWSGDTVRLDARITAAIGAARSGLGIDLADGPRVVVGYSQGALRAEALATRFPDRYPRAVLIAGPRAPKDGNLAATEAVLFMVGDHDARGHLHDAATKLKAHGRNARYLELPGAHHGDYGSEPLRTVTEGLDWLFRTPTALGG